MGRTKERIKSNNPSFKRALVGVHGDRCVNCGSGDDIEFHHIVPLSLGGTNNYGNVVPLCWKCHKAVHGGITLDDLQKSKPNNGGRRRVPSEIANKVFEKYLNGEIGNIKANELLGYKSKTTRLNGREQFRDYCKEKGIKRVDNRIDLHAVITRDGLFDGRWVGRIEYMNGDIQDIYYKDTGENDVEYEMRGPTWNRE